MKYTLLPLILFIVACNSNSQSQQQQTATDTNISDSALFDTVERRTFEYFWTGAEPNSGMAAERIHLDNNYPENDQSTVAVGGSGFGLMAILAGINRNYITREQGFQRLQKNCEFS